MMNSMENKRNYQRELELIIEKNLITASTEGTENNCRQAPTLFLHACCAPCSSYCLEYLCRYFKITVFFYNPNITMEQEYVHRVEEEKRLITAYNAEMEAGKREGIPISIIEGDYVPLRFLEMAKGLEDCPEGGERCFKCFELRLRETFETAKRFAQTELSSAELKESLAETKPGYDYVTTTLTISPLKNAAKLNEIGELLSKEYGIKWLPSDFKKKNGYKRSIELSAEYDLYRQDFCGCAYSKAEREQAKNLSKYKEFK